MSEQERERTMQGRLPDEAQTLDAQESAKRPHREPGDYGTGESQAPKKKAAKKAESETGAEGS